MTVAVIMVMMMVVMTMIVMMMAVIVANPLNMMMMADLRHTDIAFITDNLLSIFAHPAVHIVVTGENFTHPVSKGIQHQRVVIQIGSLDELDIRMQRGDFICLVIDAMDQHPGEQKIRKDDNALKAKA